MKHFLLTIIGLFLFFTGTKAETYSGACGENLTWTLDTETGVLNISGSGDMKFPEYAAPWGYYTMDIQSVNIEEGVTSICKGAFEFCSFCKSVSLPNSLSYIGESTFRNCYKLTSIVIPDGIKELSNRIFSGCTSLISITLPNSIENIGIRAFRGCN